MTDYLYREAETEAMDMLVRHSRVIGVTNARRAAIATATGALNAIAMMVGHRDAAEVAYRIADRLAVRGMDDDEQ